MEIGRFEAAATPPTMEFECALEAADFHKEWVRCSMLANYVAGYTAYQFARREWAENLISTVANDFLEAIIRLSPGGSSLSLHCALYSGCILLEASHGLRPDLAQEYCTFLSELNTGNTDALYFKLLTATERSLPPFNQFGLMMLAHDFGACLAARLGEVEGTAITRVFIPSGELT